MPLLSNVISSAGSSGSADPVVLGNTTALLGQIQQPIGTRLLHTYGTDNLFLGSGAGNFSLVTANAVRNSVMGALALSTITGTASGGNDNSVFGYSAGKDLKRANRLVVIGSYALASAGSIGTGDNGLNSSVFIGYSVGQNLTKDISMSNMVAIGASVLSNSSHQGGSYSAVLIGTGAGSQYNQIIESCLIGNNAGGNGEGSGNKYLSKAVALGAEALSGSPSAITRLGQIAIGYGAGKALFGDYSIAIGYEALDATLTGAARNLAIGYQAATALTTGADNTYIGYQSGLVDILGLRNTCVGTYSGKAIPAGASRTDLVCIGYNTMSVSQNSNNSVIIGSQAGETVGVNDIVAIGMRAGNSIGAGGGSIYIGRYCGYRSGASLNNTYANICIGHQVMYASGNFTGDGRNTIIGHTAARPATSIEDNVIMGYGIGYAAESTTDLLTGKKNTLLGNLINVGAAARLGSIGLGYKASVGADNVAVFGAANGAGNANGELNAIGVGTTTPTLFWQSDEMSGMTTDLGGYAIKLINKTGANSVKGTLVSADTGVDDACRLTPLDGLDTIGIMWSDGVADGSAVWVVVSGIAQVKTGAAATRGQFVRQSVTTDTGAAAGIAITEAAPTTPFATDNHFREVGHCIQTTGAAGLARCVIHFN